MMKEILKSVVAAAAVGLLTAACASKKVALGDATGTPVTAGLTSAATAPAATSTADYVKKVLANATTASNIVADMTFNIKMGSKDITVPGSLHMRRGEVVRLQLFIPLIGTEVGRIEFSPNRVLVVDRIHKEYIEADYTQLDFLKNNNLNFYSLEALFWNQLLVPGKQQVGIGDAANFTIGSNSDTATSQSVRLTSGNLSYNWATVPQTGQIVMANVSYASARSGASSLLWLYSDFKKFGTKAFPAHHEFTFSTTASKQVKPVKVTMELETMKDKADWDVRTTVSSKYKKVEATDVLGKLLRF